MTTESNAMSEDLHNKVRPYLSTNEATTITGTTRRVLMTMAKHNICQPIRQEKDNVLYWPISELNKIDRANILHASGMSLDRIAQLFNESMDTVIEETHLALVNQIRHTRRSLKNVTLDNERQRAMSEILNTVGKSYYIRYIPERWLAVSGSQEATECLPGSSAFTDCVVDTFAISETVGWCATRNVGVVLSYDELGKHMSSYAFGSLASPPMPKVTGSIVVDGGCYSNLANSGFPSGCERSRCNECARFGHRELPANRSALNSDFKNTTEDPSVRHVGTGANDTTCTGSPWIIQNIEKPYPSGIWSEYTQSALGSAGDADTPETDSSGKAMSEDNPYTHTVKPRFMPQEVELPLCVGACVIPAGFYLCNIIEENNIHASAERLAGYVEMFERDIIDTQRELELSRENGAWVTFKQRGSGPFIEPFAENRTIGDKRFLNYYKKIKHSEFKNLVAPFNTGLDPENGFSIICEALPSGITNDALYEIQTLVEVPPELINLTKRIES